MDDNSTVIQADSPDIQTDKVTESNNTETVTDKGTVVEVDKAGKKAKKDKKAKTEPNTVLNDKDYKKYKRLKTRSAFFLGTTVLLVMILVLLTAGAWWYYSTFFSKTTARVDELNAYYEQEYNALLDKYNGLVSDYDAKTAEYEQLKKDNEVTVKNLENLEKTLDEYNRQIEEANKAEEDFANSLTEEERANQGAIMEYNAKIRLLRESDPEFNSLYLDVVRYLTLDKWTDKDRKEFLKKFEEMSKKIEELEKQMQEEGKDND